MKRTRSISSVLLALALLLGVVGGAAATTRRSASNTATSSSKSKTAARKSVKRKPRVRAQMEPTADRISEIQSALATRGVYQGDPTGKWDDGTVDAMKKFQSSQGLTASGKLDALSLEKLGLGADTAGRGAPVPGATSEPNLLISRTQPAPAAPSQAPVQSQPAEKQNPSN